MQALLVCEPLAALKVWILVRWVEGPLPHWLLFFSSSDGAGVDGK